MRSWLRSASFLRLALPALIATLGVGGFFFTSETISRDRDAASARQAQVTSVQIQNLLGNARAFFAGLGNVLAGSRAVGERRFATVATNTAAGLGLEDALWVQRVPSSQRARYERQHGQIARMTATGFQPAPAAASYLPATFTTRTNPDLRPGVDVSSWSPLADAIRDSANAFGVSASQPGALGGRPGFYLVEAATYGSGPDNQGFLVVFVPQGWLTTSLQDPQRVAISLDGVRADGGLVEQAAARASFLALGGRWRIDVGRAPLSGLQLALPWLALGWPIAAALLAYLVAHLIMSRRRAERAAERIFDVSLDLLCVVDVDGHLKQVNPAFERRLGYSSRELLSRPLSEFIHPADRGRAEAAFDRLRRGKDVVEHETRWLSSDGSELWLQWSARAEVDGGLIFGVGRDITERRRADAQLREAQRAVEASRDELRVLAQEQTALRRVATLVARGPSPDEVFQAVCDEVAQLLDAAAARVWRYEPDGTATVVASRDMPSVKIPAGARFSLEGENVIGGVLRVGGAARVDDFDGKTGSIAAANRAVGIRSAMGAPIIVEGSLWGVMVVAWTELGRPSDAIEARLTKFTELVDVAIANAHSRAELTASRARVVAAADETRRRIERELHDDTQQRLVSLALELRNAADAVPPEINGLRAQLSRTVDGLASMLENLQEITRGIHPVVLTQGGLNPALKALARRSVVPVELDLTSDRRFTEEIETAVYHVVSEALSNAAKHANASLVWVTVQSDDRAVLVAIRDEGVGGADPRRGSGLIGLTDRVESLGGKIELASPAGGGTSLRVTIPIGMMPPTAGLMPEQA
jgi:PAS domain S-box-containing protein